MITIQECDERVVKQLAAAIGKAAIGKPISFVFEEGTHRIVDDGQVFEQPNGTVTIRIFVSGGAKDTGEQYGQANDDVSGRRGTGGEPVEALHPALAADTAGVLERGRRTDA